MIGSKKNGEPFYIVLWQRSLWEVCSEHSSADAARKAANQCERDGGGKHVIVEATKIPRKIAAVPRSVTPRKQSNRKKDRRRKDGTPRRALPAPRKATARAKAAP